MDPLNSPSARAVVLIFSSVDCPIARRYVPEIRRLQQEYAARSVAFWIIHSNTDETAGAVAKHAQEFEYPCPVLLDSTQSLARRAHARFTPEAALFSMAGKLVYHGRIDNRFIGNGQVRPEPTQRDLRDAIDAVLAGCSPASPSARAVGCYIYPRP